VTASSSPSSPHGVLPTTPGAEQAEPGPGSRRPRAGLGTIDTLLAVGLIFAGAFIVLVVAAVIWAVLAVLAHLAGAA
jgi:hypothetical protein